MSETTVKWNKIKYKIWFQQTKERIKQGAKDTVKWVADHPMETIALVGGAAGVVKKASNIYCTHREDVRRKRDFWDPRTGRHSYANRNLKSWEEELVDERYSNGESYISILRDMNLLK